MVRTLEEIEMDDKTKIRLKYIFFEEDWTPVEFFSSTLSIFWGMWLIAFTDFDQSISYSAMQGIAPEGYWGLAMMLIGITHLYSLFQENIKRRKLTMLLITSAWIFILTMFVISNHTTTGVPTYLMIAIFSFWAYARIR